MIGLAGFAASEQGFFFSRSRRAPSRLQAWIFVWCAAPLMPPRNLHAELRILSSIDRGAFLAYFPIFTGGSTVETVLNACPFYSSRIAQGIRHSF